MNIKDLVNVDVAIEQWNNLKATIEKCGAVVNVMEPDVCSKNTDENA